MKSTSTPPPPRRSLHRLALAALGLVFAQPAAHATSIIGAEQYNPGGGTTGPPSPINCVSNDLLQTSLSSATGELTAEWRSGLYADAVTAFAAEENAATIPSPVLPGVTADPHIAVFGTTFCLYPTTDMKGWNPTAFHGWTSKDLKNWKDEGVILDLPGDVKWATGQAWAPAIATKNGKYYFYFSANQNIGVAVSDHPMKSFKDPLGKPLVAKGDFPCQVIDPMVFVDDDGAAYLYFGQGKCMAVKLNDDMISFERKDVKAIELEGYNEGPFVFKRKGVYYLGWSEHDTRDPRYSVAYATAKFPLGPYEKAEGGPILQQKGEIKAAGHHSIAQVPGKDEWVVAYHRFLAPRADGVLRETCISPLRFDGKGAILPVDIFEPIPDNFIPGKQP